MRTNFLNRGERLSEIVDMTELVHDYCLVKAVRLSGNTVSQLQTSAMIHVWHSLCQAHPDRSYALTPSVLEDYASDILDLPNRTPNGLLIPRRETFLSFNMVQQTIVKMIQELQLHTTLESFQAPCNFRILSGDSENNHNLRPYASSKIHTDVWYGEPVRSLLFNLPLLGNTNASRLNFFEPQIFPDHLQQPLGDYDDGHEVASNATKLVMDFSIGLLYLSDSLSLHQTANLGPGIRLSLDWRAMPSKKLKGEVETPATSRANYIPTEDFFKGGYSLVFTDSDPIDGFLRRSRGENFDITPIETVALETKS